VADVVATACWGGWDRIMTANNYHVISNLIRDLHGKEKSDPDHPVDAWQEGYLDGILEVAKMCDQLAANEPDAANIDLAASGILSPKEYGALFMAIYSRISEVASRCDDPNYDRGHYEEQYSLLKSLNQKLALRMRPEEGDA
jgi:hypothetical protein